LQELNKGQETKEDENDKKWLMEVKTHIGKYQANIITFNIKKYFRKWRSKNFSSFYRAEQGY